ncbi:MAG: hypothetical protein H7Y59_00430 [Anaerolineales bacterium]|nr:hypothetical protein [Anaerolineales bacterium]
MAKKDNKDSTPIEFYIPPTNLGGRGPRVPIPINQPNWKYKTGSNPYDLQMAVAKICLVAAIALSILIFVSRLYTSPLWIAVIVLGTIAFISVRSAKTSEFQNTENDESNHPAKRKAKKRIKHRKDYQ